MRETDETRRVHIDLRLSMQHDDEDILATRVRNLLEQHLAFLKEHDANIGAEGRVVHFSGVVSWKRRADGGDEHMEEL